MGGQRTAVILLLGLNLSAGNAIKACISTAWVVGLENNEIDVVGFLLYVVHGDFHTALLLLIWLSDQL